ncbi:MAG: LTA synthase family protein [Lachnospiraceae bacterium]|nr:LTA synthase family protein [Lachnospiraceae bacterium]
MKNKISKMLQSNQVIITFFLLKLCIYYYLIGGSFFSLLYLPISAVIIIFIFGHLSASHRKHRSTIFSVCYIIISITMFADAMYFNYYNQTVSIAQLWQVKNVAKVPESFIATFIPSSVFLLLDVPILISCFRRYIRIAERRKSGNDENKIGRRQRYIKAICGISLFIIIVYNPINSKFIAKICSNEFFLNHTIDIYDETVGRIFDTSLDKEEVLEMMNENVQNETKNDLQGIAEGRNVIMIQVEALQNFVINRSYNGVELTPNINKLIQSDSIYFDHFYTNVGKGNTSDAEFSALNSLYPSAERESYTLYQDNNFSGLPWKLTDRGYDTFAVHGYEKEFWNRNEAYPNQGIQEFYAMEDLDDSEIIGLGISDMSVFSQTVDIMKAKTGQFFSFVVTLTNHHPYILDEDKCEIPVMYNDLESKFASYLQTVHYTDKAIGQFIERLKAEGLYDNSIIVLYGDHHGLNKDMDDNDIYMSRFIGKEYDYDEMMKVPMIINIPGSGCTRTISVTGGQIDIYPTVANLLNIELDDKYVLGQDLINAESGFVAFTSYMLPGSFVTDGMMYEMPREELFEMGRAWDPDTGKELTLDDRCREYYEKAISLKVLSEEILEQDLIN